MSKYDAFNSIFDESSDDLGLQIKKQFAGPGPFAEKKCMVCGEMFGRNTFVNGRKEPPSHYQARKTCSNSCAKVLTKITIYGPLYTFVEKQCDICGKVFGRNTYANGKESPKHYQRRLTCSKKCARQYIGKLNRIRPFEAVFNAAKLDSRRRNIEWCISYEDFVELIEGGKALCHYCRTPLSWTEYNAGNNGLGSGHQLDRKDNNKVYLKDNCVPCCPRCNYAKSNCYTYEEWCLMTAHHRQPKWTATVRESEEQTITEPELVLKSGL